MPVRTVFNEHALAYLTPLSSPSSTLPDSAHIPVEIGTLSSIGRTILRCCIVARTLNQPISKDFEEKTDAKLEHSRLARVAQTSGLVERLKVFNVATDTTDIGSVLCAYVGATLVSGWNKSAVNTIDESVNVICSGILDEAADSTMAENHSHEGGMTFGGDLPGVVSSASAMGSKGTNARQGARSDE
ncbi:hypothetical protein RhiJN_11153 [Ceratobasidium sp. AG-Ba]|nr:hypothetical protein RhiJN_11153 [Ceratobasidium sp. AG-Ba]QRW11858.1 hypothetical protein RhiLY_10857 [Ceratobasidium sp. AG-Ba]